MRLSVILPCYNEQDIIGATVRSVEAWFQKTKKAGEIIVVDDGSRDSSRKILEDLKREIPRIKLVYHDRNQGYGAAVRSGCDAAREDIVAFMDSDGQFDINDLDLLLPHLSLVPFVTGRRKRRADPAYRNMYGKVLGLFSWIVFGLWVRDVNCGLKAFRRDIWQRIRPEHGIEKLFNTEVFLHLRRQEIPWEQVDTPHYPRLTGKPTGGLLHVLRRMIVELWNLHREMRDDRRARRFSRYIEARDRAFTTLAEESRRA